MTRVPEVASLCFISLSGLSLFLGAEGGADQWERPKVEYFYPETDHLIFQQIDIQESQTSKGSPMLKMYGVTRVSNTFLLLHLKTD